MKKEYSLALGGGAARGFIHIGVIKYLEENKINISEISGTSMGAIIGSLYAAGKSIDEMIQIAKDINYFKLVDLDLKHGFLKGDKVQKLLDSIFGDVMIEDLNMKLHIVATCLETGERKVFTTGRLSDAVRASLSLPGVFKPKKIGEYSYIDGGITTNLPIDVLKGKNIIGVSALKIITGELSTSRKIFGMELSKGFLNLNYQIIHRTILTMMKQNEDRSVEKVKGNFDLISPNFGELDYYNFNAVDEFVEMGYEEIKKTL